MKSHFEINKLTFRQISHFHNLVREACLVRPWLEPQNQRERSGVEAYQSLCWGGPKSSKFCKGHDIYYSPFLSLLNTHSRTFMHTHALLSHSLLFRAKMCIKSNLYIYGIANWHKRILDRESCCCCCCCCCCWLPLH